MTHGDAALIFLLNKHHQNKHHQIEMMCSVWQRTTLLREIETFVAFPLSFVHVRIPFGTEPKSRKKEKFVLRIYQQQRFILLFLQVLLHALDDEWRVVQQRHHLPPFDDDSFVVLFGPHLPFFHFSVWKALVVICKERRKQRDVSWVLIVKSQLTNKRSQHEA